MQMQSENSSAAAELFHKTTNIEKLTFIGLVHSSLRYRKTSILFHSQPILRINVGNFDSTVLREVLATMSRWQQGEMEGTLQR